MPAPSPAPGWYPSEFDGEASRLRYWDGQRWTEHTRTAAASRARPPYSTRAKVWLGIGILATLALPFVGVIVGTTLLFLRGWRLQGVAFIAIALGAFSIWVNLSVY